MSTERNTDVILKEYRPLTHVLKKIPRKAQCGLWKVVDIVIRCLDANSDYIALGSNIGTVFLYDRKQQDITRLKSDVFLDDVTCVKIHVGLNVQIAFGTDSGIVNIFQLPSKMVGHNKELQRFKINDLHSSKITTLRWNTNGQRLFSADTAGVIVSSETNFLQNSCKSEEILQENIEVVQMDYSFHMLLISTLLRTVICFVNQNYRVIQIGQKDRRCLGNYGACFGVGSMNANDVTLYTSRPGLRIWEAKHGGVVESTYIFRESIDHPQTTIPLLKDEPVIAPISSLQFSRLSVFNDDYLMSWSAAHLCLLSLSENTVVATQANLGLILDVAVTNNEIFVLRHNCEPAVVRIATDVEAHIENLEPYSISHTNLAPKLGPTESLARNITLSSKIHADDLKRSESPLRYVKKNIFDKLLNQKASPVNTLARQRSITPPTQFRPIETEADSRDACGKTETIVIETPAGQGRDGIVVETFADDVVDEKLNLVTESGTAETVRKSTEIAPASVLANDLRNSNKSTSDRFSNIFLDTKSFGDAETDIVYSSKTKKKKKKKKKK